jgi:hypothetical protein
VHWGTLALDARRAARGGRTRARLHPLGHACDHRTQHPETLRGRQRGAREHERDREQQHATTRRRDALARAGASPRLEALMHAPHARVRDRQRVDGAEQLLRLFQRGIVVAHVAQALHGPAPDLWCAASRRKKSLRAW